MNGGCGRIFFRLRSSGLEETRGQAGSICPGLAVCVSFFACCLITLPAPGAEPDALPYNLETATAQAEILKSPVDSVDLATFPEPKDLLIHNWRIKPYLSFDETFSDNSQRKPTHKKEDVLLDSVGGFTATTRPNECFKTSLSYEFGWHDYLRDTERDFLSHRASFDASLERVGIEGLSLEFGDQYIQTTDNDVLNNEIVQFARNQTNRAFTHAQYRYNRLKFTGEYAYFLQDYFDREPGKSNFRTHSGSLDGSWFWLPGRLEIFDSFQYQRTLYDHAAITDFDSVTELAGVRGSYSKLTYSAGFGYAMAAPLFENGVKGNPSFSIALGYAPHRRISFDLVATRGFVAGVRTGATLETDASAALKLLLTRRGTLELKYVRDQSDRFSGVHQLSVAYSARFEYKLTRNTALGATLTRYERTSTIATDTFAVDEIKTGFKLVW